LRGDAKRIGAARDTFSERVSQKEGEVLRGKSIHLKGREKKNKKTTEARKKRYWGIPKVREGRACINGGMRIAKLLSHESLRRT